MTPLRSGYDTEDEQAGRRAVRKKYGDKVWQRIENWPLLAREMAVCEYLEGEEIEREVMLAERNLKRARRDPEYALNQGEVIARSGYSDDELVTVFSGMKRRQRIEQAEAEARAELRKWAKENPDRTTTDPGSFGWLAEFKKPADLLKKPDEETP